MGSCAFFLVLAAIVVAAPGSAARQLHLATSDSQACAPGRFRSSDNPAAACEPCGTSAFCADGVRTECAEGTTTVTTTAGDASDCVTLPGFGHDGTLAAPCPLGFYSVGGTRAPCRPCAAGLTTTAPGATSADGCVAPAGHYVRRGTVRPCPKGTFTAHHTPAGALVACSLCPTGTTTAAEGSSSADDCSVAKPGFHLAALSAAGTGAAAAEPCPIGTYAAAERAATDCAACPAGLTTAAPGATSVDACVAAPGVGFRTSDGAAAPCPVGTYKMGFNLAACAACGSGLSTRATGSTSFSDCFVPAGFGARRGANGAVEAVACTAGTFGVPADTFGLSDVPCTACPAGTTSSAAGVNAGPSACVTLPGYGLDAETGELVRCPQGTWASGNSADEPCHACADGLTTAGAGAATRDACIAVVVSE